MGVDAYPVMGNGSTPEITEKQFEALFLESEAFENLEARFGHFCPFEALGMVRAEIRHGNFLATMLDPHAHHGYGSDILRGFLLCAVRGTAQSRVNTHNISLLNIHLADLDSARIMREWRSIDIVLEIEREKIVIAIELKIDASQRMDQLCDYRKIVESHWSDPSWRRVYIFLTKHDEQPEKTESQYWVPLHLESVVEELESQVRNHNMELPAGRMLEAYNRMMRRHHVGNDELEKLAADLWTHHRQVLSYLADQRPDEIAAVLESILEEAHEPSGLIRKLHGSSENWVIDSTQKNVIRIAFLPWDKIGILKGGSTWTESKRFLLFQIQRDRNKISGFLHLGPGTEHDRAKIVDIIRDHRGSGARGQLGERWTTLDKKELFNLPPSGEIELKAIRRKIEQGFVDFALQTVEKFDPLLKSMAFQP